VTNFECEYIEAKIRVQVLARRFKQPDGKPLNLLALLRRPRVQAFLSELGLTPIGERIHSEQLELEHWEALLEWMDEQMAAKSK